MHNPVGFDPKPLSNDELFNKQLELARRKVMAGRMGRSELASQLDVMIQAIDAERRERMFLDRFNTLPSSPVVIETDPDLRQQDETAAEEINTAKTVQPARPTRRPVRSSTPIKPGE